jgi:hypothetical protein
MPPQRDRDMTSVISSTINTEGQEHTEVVLQNEVVDPRQDKRKALDRLAKLNNFDDEVEVLETIRRRIEIQK